LSKEIERRLRDLEESLNPTQSSVLIVERSGEKYRDMSDIEYNAWRNSLAPNFLVITIVDDPPGIDMSRDGEKGSILNISNVNMHEQEQSRENREENNTQEETKEEGY
jgi:hypothetical protein